MLITYRRTGGVFALLALAAVALAATALAAAVVIGVVAIAATLFLVRAVLPASWRHSTVPPPTPWPYQTIDATVVDPTGSSDERDLLRLDSDKG